MRTIRSTCTIAAFAVVAGCSSALPPQDLVTARASYARASHGPAATLDPAALHSAAGALEAAEHSFVSDGDSQATRDLAYVADRRAQLAEAQGETKQAARQQEHT
jgi:hypothetical protein